MRHIKFVSKILTNVLVRQKIENRMEIHKSSSNCITDSFCKLLLTQDRFPNGFPKIGIRHKGLFIDTLTGGSL